MVSRVNVLKKKTMLESLLMCAYDAIGKSLLLFLINIHISIIFYIFNINAHFLCDDLRLPLKYMLLAFVYK